MHVVTTIHTRLPLDPADIRLGVSVGTVPALPAGPPRREDPPAPERILRSLPEREREAFLAEYRLAVDGARDPAGWPELLRFLRLWSFRAIAVNQPGLLRSLGAGKRGRRDAPGGRDQALPARHVSYRPLDGAPAQLHDALIPAEVPWAL